MQFDELAKRVAVSKERIREWIRQDIVRPSSPSQGSGNHSIYDDASLVAIAVAQELSELAVVVGKYKAAFAGLHTLLRAKSSLEWPQLLLRLTPSKAELFDKAEVEFSEETVIQIDLERVCVGLMLSEPQQTLNFGIRSV